MKWGKLWSLFCNHMEWKCNKWVQFFAQDYGILTRLSPQETRKQYILTYLHVNHRSREGRVPKDITITCYSKAMTITAGNLLNLKPLRHDYWLWHEQISWVTMSQSSKVTPDHNKEQWATRYNSSKGMPQLFGNPDPNKTSKWHSHIQA